MANERVLKLIRDIVLFIPLIIAGTILHVIGDFKNHKLGYIVIFFFFAIVVCGVVMGILAGPSSPAPWDS